MSLASRRTVVMLVALLLAAATLVLWSPPEARAADFLVTSNADSGPGTLRDAIDQANVDVDSDTITFASDMTIQPLTHYHLMEHMPVTIDAQGRNIVLDCSLMPANEATECLLVTTEDNIINGLRIVNVPVTGDPAYGVGIRIRNTYGNRVTRCYLGTADGSTAASNDTGVAIEGGGYPANLIGTPGEGNVISGNRTCGVRVVNSDNVNRVQDNMIGTNAAGTSPLGNGTYGVLVDTADTDVWYNVISACTNSVYLQGGANLCQVAGNHIGTNAAGTAVLSNPNTDTGVYVGGTMYASVGGNEAASRNVISGVYYGVYIDAGAWPTAVSGNYIGTDETGSSALGIGRAGVCCLGTGSLIGDLTHPFGNVIAAAGEANVELLDPASDCRVQSNFIGLNAAGDAALGNTPTGVLVTGPNNLVGWPYGLMLPHGLYGQGNVGGGGNVISGHSGAGIDVRGAASGTTIMSNFIGLNAAGTRDIHNATGVRIATPGNAIGGSNQYEGNVISGAEGWGVDIESGDGNRILQNLIGTDFTGGFAIPNGSGDIHVATSGNSIGGSGNRNGNVISGSPTGILFSGYAESNTVMGNLIGLGADRVTPIPNSTGIVIQSQGNTVGGDASGQQNVIAHNTGSAVRVAVGAMGNTVAANSMYGNGILGIDLDPQGVNTPQSDYPYPTEGAANRWMHFPVITRAVSEGGLLTIEGTAEPSSQVRLFFADGNETAFGEGKQYIATINATAAGAFSFSGDVSLATQYVTATATDTGGTVTAPELGQIPTTFGNTSEFGLNVHVQGPTPPSGLSTTYYLAEGYTADAPENGDQVFDTYVLIQNPSDTAAEIKATFMKNAGQDNVVQHYTVEPHSRLTIYLDEVPGLEATEVSTKIESTNDVGIAVERSMYFNYRGCSGGHGSIATTSPGKKWYFAEGCTAESFDTWLLVQNPGDAAAQCQVTYMDDVGRTLTEAFNVAPNSRHTVFVDEVPGFEKSNFAIEVESDVPVVAERSMYFNYSGCEGGHNSVGASAPSTSWFLPEGYTGRAPAFDTWDLLLNPDDEPCEVTATFYMNGVDPVNAWYTIAPHSRCTIKLNGVAGLDDADVSSRFESTNGVGFIAERSSYFDYHGIEGGTNSMGATEVHSQWYVPEGYSSDAFDTWILLENPNEVEAICDCQFMTETGQVVTRSWRVPPRNRFSINVFEATGIKDVGVATAVYTSKSTPIIVEKATYYDYRGMNDGTSSVGIGTF